MQKSARQEYQLFVYLRKGDVTRFAQSEKRVPVGKPGRHAAEPKLRSRWAHAFCSEIEDASTTARSCSVLGKKTKAWEKISKCLPFSIFPR